MMGHAKLFKAVDAPTTYLVVTSGHSEKTGSFLSQKANWISSIYNSYKHGFRLFPFKTLGENDTQVSAIIYFSKNDKHDQVIVATMDKNPQKHQKLAKDIIYFIRIILKNHENKLKEPDNWEMIVPEKRKNNE